MLEDKSIVFRLIDFLRIRLGGSEPPSEARWRVYRELFEGTDNSGDLLRSTQACFVIMTHQICTSAEQRQKNTYTYICFRIGRLSNTLVILV